MDNKITIGIMCMILALVVCLPFPASAVKYCVDNALYENITVGGTVVNILTGNCPFGCYDNITAYGGACSEPDINNMSVAFGLIIAFIFLIFTLPKVLKKRKGKR